MQVFDLFPFSLLVSFTDDGRTPLAVHCRFVPSLRWLGHGRKDLTPIGRGSDGTPLGQSDVSRDGLPMGRPDARSACRCADPHPVRLLRPWTCHPGEVKDGFLDGLKLVDHRDAVVDPARTRRIVVRVRGRVDSFGRVA